MLLQLKYLIKLLCVEHVLGKVIGRIHVIEFQKRGLPHAHMLLCLDDADKIRTPDDIDRVVWAEIPGVTVAGAELTAAGALKLMPGPLTLF